MFREQLKTVLVLSFSFITSLSLSIHAQETETLRQRNRELEKENSQLRKTTELQAVELLELRRKIKDLETVHLDSTDT